MGSLFSKETEPRGSQLRELVGKEPRGKWKMGLKKIWNQSEDYLQSGGILVHYSTHSQNPGRQLNFALEILKKEPQN